MRLQDRYTRALMVNDDYDLRAHFTLKSVGYIDPLQILSDMPEDDFFRPRKAIKRHEIIDKEFNNFYISAPKSLRDLYRIAANDIAKEGLDAKDYDLYVLTQSGMVASKQSLRADFWHFDLERLHRRLNIEAGKFPVAIEYAVSSSCPTLFISHLPSEKSLKARQTIVHKDHHQDLAAKALIDGHVKHFQAGDVVRYDNLTMHRGGVNNSCKPKQRAFMHLAFVAR